jgi:hypothetical protein
MYSFDVTAGGGGQREDAQRWCGLAPQKQDLFWGMLRWPVRAAVRWLRVLDRWSVACVGCAHRQQKPPAIVAARDVGVGRSEPVQICGHSD